MDWVEVFKDLGVPVVAAVVLFNITNKLVDWVLKDLTQKWDENHKMCIKNLENLTAFKNQQLDLMNKIHDAVDDIERKLK